MRKPKLLASTNEPAQQLAPIDGGVNELPEIGVLASSRVDELVEEVGARAADVRHMVDDTSFDIDGQTRRPRTRQSADALQQVRTKGGDGLVVGATLGVALTLVPAALRRFRDAHPQAPLRLRTTVEVPDLIAMVLAREVDLGVLRDVQHPDLEAITIFENPLVVVVSPGHPLASTARTADQLSNEELVIFDWSAPEHYRVLTILREQGVIPRMVTATDTLEVAKRLVEEGVGVTVVPRSNVIDELRRGSLVEIKPKGLALPVRRVIVVRRSDAGRLPKDHAAFVASLQKLGRAVIARG